MKIMIENLCSVLIHYLAKFDIKTKSPVFAYRAFIVVKNVLNY